MQRRPVNRNFLRSSKALLYGVPPVLVTVVLWVTAATPVTAYQAFLALLLLIAPWILFLQWKRERKQQIPLLSLICFTYWMAFGVALFWGDHHYPGNHFWRNMAESTVDGTMLMAVVGTFSLLAGARFGASAILLPPTAMGGPRTRAQWRYLHFLLMLRVIGSPFAGGGGDARQVFLVLIDFIPLVAFVLLFRKFLDGQSTFLEKVLLWLFIGASVMLGLTQGWMGQVVGLFIIIGLLYLERRNTVPKLAIGVLLVYILFFQVGKDDFRQRYWIENGTTTTTASSTDRVAAWVTFSLHRWQDLYEHPSSEVLQNLTAPTINRINLLKLAGVVVEETPHQVPYQGARLYEYMMVTLIPRFVWPSKPSFNEANQFYQVAYGITRPDQLEFTSISVGMIAEAYIGFGWEGVIGVMFLVGMFVHVFQSLFLNSRSPVVLSAIGIAMLPYLLVFDAQLVQYLSGMLQHVFVAYVLLLPITTGRRGKQPSSRLRPAGSMLQSPPAVSVHHP